MNKNNPPKLTPEQLKMLRHKFLELQKRDGQNQAPQSNIAKSTKKFSWRSIIRILNPINIFGAIIFVMHKSVSVIDGLIKFIVKKDLDSEENVVHHARPPILFGSLIIICFVATGLIWSVTAPLDSASVAIGTLISSSKRQIINHNKNGRIKTIFVKLGDQVKIGDKLLELEDKELLSKYSSVLSKFRIFSAAQSRMLAEINNFDEIEFDKILKDFPNDPEVIKIIENQNSLFTSRKKHRQNVIDLSTETIKILDKTVQILQNKQIALDKKLYLTKQKLENATDLEKKGFGKTMQVSELEAEMIVSQVEIDNNKHEILKTTQEIAKKKIELTTSLNDMDVRLQQELKENQQNLFIYQEEFYNTKNTYDEMTIRSPIDGSINQIISYTKGQFIPASQPLMEIAPLNEKLIIEAQVPNKDIDSIKLGQKAKIKFSAFKSRTSPTFSGKVISISPDIVINQSTQQQQSGGKKGRNPGPVYIAEVEINMEEFNKIAEKRHLKLYPGMQAEVQIVTGSRTLLQYLLDPILDAAFKGLKEK